MLKDYSEIVERLQKALGRNYVQSPWLLNVPGQSIACKVDQHYYLAVMPAFVEQMGKIGGMLPDRVAEALVKTGNFITKAPERNPVVPLTLGWAGPPITVKAAFVEAEFIDRAVKTYGAAAGSLSVSELKISVADRPKLEAFFEGKTPPQDLAYY